MTYTLHCGDCVEYMRSMDDNSIDLIVTDPPYHRVKMNEEWDRQHKTAADFIVWIDTALEQFHRILKPNGSLYLFASPRMAARVEVAIGERFNVLNSIVWNKSAEPTHALKYGDDRFRQYVQKSERLIFAEHYGADNIAKGEAGYAAKCDELRGFLFEPLRAYLDGERERAGVTVRQVAEQFQKKTGSRTVTGMAGHWFGPVQWMLPTEENYLWLRQALSRLNHGGEYLQRSYEDLRTEYEDLRREYEDLRRPFSVSADVPYTDVWTFPTVSAYRGKHSCEKPLSMMEHVVGVSSKPGAVVFDPFMGSGTTGVACQSIGNRQFIGCDLDQRWVDRTQQRIDEQGMQLELFAGVA